MLIGAAGLLGTGFLLSSPVNADDKKEVKVVVPVAVTPVVPVSEVAIYRPQVKFRTKFRSKCKVLEYWERIVLWLVGISTVGLGYLIVYPFLTFQRYQRSISLMRVGNKRLRFTGDIWEYYSLYFKNLALSVCTLGIYSLLGYGEIKEADYVDRHIEVIE